MTYSYVGSRTTKERNARGKGLKIYNIDENTGDWKEIQRVEILENPSYMAFDNKKEYLYTVHGDLTEVSCFKIEKYSGRIKFINTVSIGGKNPVFLTVDKDNKYLLVATLQGGTVYSIKLNEDGSLGDIVYKEKFEGRTDNAVSFAHQCIWDKNKKFLFVPTQGRVVGYGQVKVLRFNSEDGSLSETYTFKSREFAEPRHIVVHENNKYVYLINEKDNTVTYFSFDDEKGILKPLQSIPTLPETYTGEGQASAIILDSRSNILLASNRIHESITTYKVDQKTGYIKNIGNIPSLGLTPRFITFNDNTGKFYVANEDSDTIVEFNLDEDTGVLTFTGRVIETESPVCILFS